MLQIKFKNEKFANDTSNKDSAYFGFKPRIKLSLIVNIYYGKIAYGTIMIKYDVLLWPLGSSRFRRISLFRFIHVKDRRCDVSLINLQSTIQSLL